MTTTESIGSLVESELTDGIATLRFTSNLAGYAGWDWVVSLAVDGDASTILETELLAGEGAIVAPDWVPWADRLKEYEASLAAGIEVDEVIVVSDDIDDDDDSDEDEDEDDDDDDDDDDDFSDDVDSLDLTDIVESRFDDTDVFDGVDDAGSEDDAEGDEYVVVEDDKDD
ncbi:MAG: hypothetical protein RLZZ319_592 [Actinomycetota bacterium]